MQDLGPFGGYTVEDRLTRVEVSMLNIVRESTRATAAFESLERKVDGRPSWSVVFYLAGLQAACGILATALILTLSQR